VDARERKATALALKKEEETRKKEDAKWVDNDKLVNAKLQRKAEADAKQDDRVRRRQELRELEAEENATLASNKKGKDTKKVTRSELLLRQLAAKKSIAEEDTKVEKQPDLLFENPNHAARQEMFDALITGKDMGVVASGIEGALEQFGDEVKVDYHPERRAKVAYKAYEERLMVELKLENPHLKRSQYLDKIYRMWQKAPENPMNQPQI